MHFLEQLEAAHVRKPQVEHDAIKPAREKGVEGLGAGRRALHLDVIGSQQLLDGAPFDLVVLDDQQPFGRGPVNSFMRSNALSRPSVVGALTR